MTKPKLCRALDGLGRRCGKPVMFGEHCKRHHNLEQRTEPWSKLAVKVARHVANRRGQRLTDAFRSGKDGDIARAVAWSELRKHNCPEDLYEAIALSYWTP